MPGPAPTPRRATDRFEALLLHALAAEEARLAALEAQVDALRSGRAGRAAAPSPRAAEPSPPAEPPPAPRAVEPPPAPRAVEPPPAPRAVEPPPAPRAVEPPPAPRAVEPPPAPPAPAPEVPLALGEAPLDDERLEAARRILVDSSQRMRELQACFARLEADAAQEAPAGAGAPSAAGDALAGAWGAPAGAAAPPGPGAPPWAQALLDEQAGLRADLARVERLLVEVARAVVAVLERGRGPADAARSAAPPPETPTARLRRALAGAPAALRPARDALAPPRAP